MDLGASLSPTSQCLFKSIFTFICSVSQVYVVSFFQTGTLVILYMPNDLVSLRCRTSAVSLRGMSEEFSS